MGFEDRDVSSSLDEMFDFDHDDRIDAAEAAMEYEYLKEMEQDTDSEYEDNDFEDDEYGGDDFEDDTEWKCRRAA